MPQFISVVLLTEVYIFSLQTEHREVVLPTLILTWLCGKNMAKVAPWILYTCQYPTKRLVSFFLCCMHPCLPPIFDLGGDMK